MLSDGDSVPGVDGARGATWAMAGEKAALPPRFRPLHLSLPDGEQRPTAHGARQILHVTQLLERAGITCCLVGTSALLFYGANRIRNDWQICVAAEQLTAATALLTAPPHGEPYQAVAHTDLAQPGSLLHTFPRFKCHGLWLFFTLVPSDDCYVACEPASIQRSLSGLPYPTLPVYIESLLATHNVVDLCDVVDGANLSEAWGDEHLDLDQPVDLAWLRRKNTAITDDAVRTRDRAAGMLSRVGLTVRNRRDAWRSVVRDKDRRLGWKHSQTLFVTRFRLRGSMDPWLMERNGV